MENKITLPGLANMLSMRTGLTKRLCEDFVRELFQFVSSQLAEGESVKIKDLGVFRLSRVEPRMSVDVVTGEPIRIPGHQKVVFVADKELAASLNTPFEAFEPVEVPVDLDDNELSKIMKEGIVESEVEEDLSELIDYEDKSVISASETVSEADPDLRDTPTDNNEPIRFDSDNAGNPEEEIVFEESSEDPLYLLPSEEETLSLVPEGNDDETIQEEHEDADISSLEDNNHEVINQPADDSVKESPEEYSSETAIISDSAIYVTPLHDERGVRQQEDIHVSEQQEDIKVAEQKGESLIAEPKEEIKASYPKEEISKTNHPSYSSFTSDRDANIADVPKDNRSFLKGFLIGLLCCLAIVVILGIFGYRSLLTKIEQLQNSEMPYEESVVIDIPDLSDSLPTAIEETTDNSETIPLSADSTAVDPDRERSASNTDNSGIQAETYPSDQKVYDTISRTRYLTTMAKEHYGNFNLWPYIYEENKSFLGHPDRIKPGTKVVIPPLSKYGVNPNSAKDIEKAKKLGAAIYARY